MKILVTGAAGFIGYHLVKALLAKGDIIVGLDNINDYYDVNLKYGRLADCGILKSHIINNQRIKSTSNTNYTFLKSDITDLTVLEKLFAEEKFDYVLHMAAQPGVRYSLQNPHAYIQSNIVGFMNILECCRYYRIKHLVYASSSSIYGFSTEIPFNENERVDFPVSLYAATKKSNELMAHTYSHLYQLSTTGLRFFTVYGPWGRPDMAPMLFADAIAKGRPIKVFNYGNMMRDFTYIDDIVEGIVRVSNLPPLKEESVKPYYRVLNIGNANPVPLLDFIKEMENKLEAKAILEMLPMQPGDVPVTYADTTQLEKIINYKAQTDIAIGLNEFIQWYKNFHSLQTLDI